MSTYTVVDMDDVEAMRGAFRKMRIALGAKAFGVNHISLPPGISGPEHDEEDTNHEEVYFVLDGAGSLQIGDQSVEMVPGRWVRVDASATRQMSAGDEGLTFIAIGAPSQAEWTGRPTL
jgi:mannose-6-phosphate isomerase-like protein (cupin superfamily)